ncbi:MAG: DegT/DnrJ/EryC1/StrS family aminotransferase [Rhodospirillaceae bacterium]
MIPFLDLTAHHASLRDELAAAVARVLDGGQFVLGPEVAAFEAAFAAYCGAAQGIAVNSGTSALHLALLAAGIGPGDEVITTPFTFVATVAAIEYTGARPVLADVEPDTGALDPAAAAACITPRTRAILPVHIHGHPADMDRLGALARRHGLALIEDAAQAHGAELDGRRVGALGDIGCFSFYPSKNLGAAGEGGIVVTSDEAVARRLRRLRDWGQDGKHNHVVKGFNARMPAIQGAVLRVKLPHLDGWIAARRRLAQRYRRALAEVPGLRLPAERPGARHVYHVFAVRTPDRDRVRTALAGRGVATEIHYPNPVHLLPPWAGLGWRAGDLPVAERLARETLSLPLYPELAEADADAVADALRDVMAEAACAS